METDFNFLGIPGAPAVVRSAFKGSIYAAILDSVPAHTSLMAQALQSNLAAGAPCVLATRMPPGEFLRMAEMSGVDFRDDIAHGRLFLFSREGEFGANIFRHGIARFLDEFDYYHVPQGSFFLFDQAWDMFTMSEQEVAQGQAIEYRDWMRAAGHTSLFLFPVREEPVPKNLLGRFNGVARITQDRTDIELLIEFWYSENGAMAARSFPVSFESSGLIRIDAANERAVDAKNTAPSRHIALTPSLAALLRGEAARNRIARRERRFQRQTGAGDTQDAGGDRDTHRRRDDN
jgi:hypothetical protein